MHIVDGEAALNGAKAHATIHSITQNVLILGTQAFGCQNAQAALKRKRITVTHISIGLASDCTHIHRSTNGTYASTKAHNCTSQAFHFMGGLHFHATGSYLHTRISEGLSGNGQIVHIHCTGHTGIKSTATLEHKAIDIFVIIGSNVQFIICSMSASIGTDFRSLAHIGLGIFIDAIYRHRRACARSSHAYSCAAIAGADSGRIHGADVDDCGLAACICSTIKLHSRTLVHKGQGGLAQLIHAHAAVNGYITCKATCYHSIGNIRRMLRMHSDALIRRKPCFLAHIGAGILGQIGCVVGQTNGYCAGPGQACGLAHMLKAAIGVNPSAATH